MTRRADPKARAEPVTLRDIADRVGVSIATVSRVLSFDPTLSVGDATRAAIVETAEAMNYAPRRRRPRASAAKVAGKRVALLHFRRPEEELADPYFVAMRLGIETRCADLQLELTKLYRTDDGMAQIPRETRAVLVVGEHSAEEVAQVRALFPHVVFVDWHPPGDDCDAVQSDRGLATRKLVAALSDLGYARIAFAGWPKEGGGLESRAQAYVDWMTEAGRHDPALLVMGANNEQSGHDAALQVLALEPRPDALVVTNDTMAVGAYRAIEKRGLAIPQDIAVASFNDISAARFLSPPLTTVRLPAETIGSVAVELLAERMAGRALARQVTVETQIVWRSSTRRPEGA